MEIFLYSTSRPMCVIFFESLIMLYFKPLTIICKKYHSKIQFKAGSYRHILEVQELLPPSLFLEFVPKKHCFFKPFPILNYGIQFNSYAKRLQGFMQNFPRSPNFHFLCFFHKFPYVTIFLLVLHFYSGKQIARGGWLGFAKASSGSDPTSFGLYPTSIPPGVIVQKCRFQLFQLFQTWN